MARAPSSLEAINLRFMPELSTAAVRLAPSKERGASEGARCRSRRSARGRGTVRRRCGGHPQQLRPGPGTRDQTDDIGPPRHVEKPKHRYAPGEAFASAAGEHSMSGKQ